MPWVWVPPEVMLGPKGHPTEELMLTCDDTMVRVTTKGLTDAWVLGHHLWPWRQLRGCGMAGALTIWMTCTAPRGHGVDQTRAVVRDHVWVSGPTEARVWVDVLSTHYHQGSCECPVARPHLGLCWNFRGPCLGPWPSCTQDLQ